MSNLYEQIEEVELQLKEGGDAEEEVNEELAEEEPKEAESEAESEDEAEAVEDEEKEEEEQEKEPEQKLDASAYVKMRREKRELQEKIAALEAANNPPAEVSEDQEPSKEDNYEEWLEWKDTQLDKKIEKVAEWQGKQDRDKEQNEIWNGAVKEFQGYEEQFQKTAPDYEAASEHMKTRLADSFSMVNPELTPQEINSRVSQYILKNAAQAAQEGYNPAESLYRQAKERFGFTKQEAPAPKKRVDLKKIDSNRKKSASPLQSGGQTNSNHVSLESLNGMTMGEFAKLTPSQLRELESQ